MSLFSLFRLQNLNQSQLIQCKHPWTLSHLHYVWMTSAFCYIFAGVLLLNIFLSFSFVRVHLNNHRTLSGFSTKLYIFNVRARSLSCNIFVLRLFYLLLQVNKIVIAIQIWFAPPRTRTLRDFFILLLCDLWPNSKSTWKCICEERSLSITFSKYILWCHILIIVLR